MNNTKNKFIVFLFVLFPSFVFSQKFDDTTKGILWEYVEWEIKDVSFSSNPYDIVAKVNFINEETNEVKTTTMFYDENKTWKFRFTGTQLGIWHFFSSSKIKELNKLSGAIEILENPSENTYGFLTNVGNKFAIQTAPDSIKGYIFNIYMNQTNPNYSFRSNKENSFLNYANEAKENGCTTIFSSVVGNAWFNFPTIATSEGIKENPDPQTFRRIEEMIAEARKVGQQVHIWAWGDEERKQTPKNIGEGINGIEDKRLQRYIIARLGPLPGWSMGYGFDLHEWVDSSQVNEWAEFMYKNLSWEHLFSARGKILSIPTSINSYDGISRNVSLSTTKYGPQNLEEIVFDLNSDLSRPHLYEERHSYNRQSKGSQNNWNLDMDGTRKLMWWEAMAGGMGGWFGYYQQSSPAYGGYPYPNPEQLATFRKFWIEQKRFLLDMVAKKNTSNVNILQSQRNNSVVLYKEDTDIISFTFNKFNNKNIIAVDTKLEYKEIRIDNNSIVNSMWYAPYRSDWVIAIGDFKNYNFPIVMEQSFEKEIQISTFIVSQEENTIDLIWETTKEKKIKGFLIEKSIGNDTTDWKIIGFINTKTNGTKNKKYKFSDIILKEKVTINYRLKILFVDRTFRYSSKVIHNNVPIISSDIKSTYFSLFQNYPNPFNNSTTIKFYLGEEANINLGVYNILGEKIETLITLPLSMGHYSYKFDANNLPSGVYYYRLTSENYSTTKKMILLK